MSSDPAVNEYIRQRNAIAKEHNVKLVKHPDWGTADYILNTNIREDSSGLALLGKFRRKLKKLKNATHYSDDGEAIGIWCKDPVEAAKQRAKSIQEKIKSKALFYPGYLPIVGRPREGMHHIRIENPNPNPYSLDVEWLWLIYYDPNKINVALEEEVFAINDGRAIHTKATIAINTINYKLPHPVINSQKKMDEILGMIEIFRKKMKKADERAKNLRFHIKNCSDEEREKYQKQIWLNL